MSLVIMMHIVTQVVRICYFYVGSGECSFLSKYFFVCSWLTFCFGTTILWGGVDVCWSNEHFPLYGKMMRMMRIRPDPDLQHDFYPFSVTFRGGIYLLEDQPWASGCEECSACSECLALRGGQSGIRGTTRGPAPGINYKHFFNT